MITITRFPSNRAILVVEFARIQGDSASALDANRSYREREREREGERERKREACNRSYEPLGNSAGVPAGRRACRACSPAGAWRC